MTSLSARLKELAKLPGLLDDSMSISMLDGNVRVLPMEPFFEPVSVTVVSKGKKHNTLNGTRELLSIGPDDLTSWTRHIAYGVRCRMRVLEEPIVAHLQDGHILPAMVLLRSHLEAAALASHCLGVLTRSMREHKLDDLKDLIPRTLFGTSIKKHRDKVPIGALLQFFEGDTIQISRAIESLDRFYYGEHAEGTLVLVYSVLCEFAHPNHRGVMDFMTASERPGGWTVSYRFDVSPNDRLISNGLETLLVSMRCGYSCAELLRAWEFGEIDGELVWRGPSPKEADRVWRHLLQRQIELADE